jgi:hypothetical protein
MSQPFAAADCQNEGKSLSKRSKPLTAVARASQTGQNRCWKNLPQLLDFIGEPGWIRTIDPLIKSQMLCH